jgi:hypothetical protein
MGLPCPPPREGGPSIDRQTKDPNGTDLSSFQSGLGTLESMTDKGSLYSNFQDPWGLVRRMLTSRQRGARAALMRAALRYAAIPFDIALRPFERRRLSSADVMPHPIVLIVGGSRTGTTLLCQTLTRHLPVTYTSNIVEVFPRSPITASRLFRFLTLRRQRANVSYQSYFGNTRGLGAPNDGFDIWNRWLGIDRYRSKQSLSSRESTELREFFEAWTTTFGQPMVNKNNRNCGVISLLARVLPQAHFVIVRRDPLYVAQSLLIARKCIQGDESIGWGFASQPKTEYPIEAVCRQVAEVEKTLKRQQDDLDPSRITHVQYETFCADPVATVVRLGHHLGLEQLYLDDLVPFETTNHRRLCDTDFSSLEREVRRQFGDED